MDKLFAYDCCQKPKKVGIMVDKNHDCKNLMIKYSKTNSGFISRQNGYNAAAHARPQLAHTLATVANLKYGARHYSQSQVDQLFL